MFEKHPDHLPVDIVLVLLALALLVTLGAFFLGLTPYPFGWMVLSIFLAARIFQLRGGPKRD